MCIRDRVRKYSHISEDGQKLFQPEKETVGLCPRCGKPVSVSYTHLDVYKRQDLILFADTGAEHPHTYAYLDVMNRWLKDHGMPPITRRCV